MIINAKILLNNLLKFDYSKETDLLLCFSETEGFYFKNNIGETNIIEEELNNFVVFEEFVSIKYIAKHLNISKPTVVKLLKDENINIITLDKQERIKLSDYLEFLHKKEVNH